MDVDQDNQKAEQESTIDIGALLVEARKNRNWSAQDIAKQMNLSLATIEKIESNQFDQSLPSTFIRGYIGSYAKKVGLDGEPLCIAFDRQMTPDSHPITKIKSVANYRNSRKEMNSSHGLFKLITYLIVLSLLSFAGWELWKKLFSEEASARLTSNDISLNIEGTDISDRKEGSLEFSLSKVEKDISESSHDQSIDKQSINKKDKKEIVDKKPSMQKKIAIQDKALENISVENRISPENNKLLDDAIEKISAQFVFTADCWVKVTDASGNVLAVGVKKNGKVMQLSGVPPISVVLGEPAAVSLSVNDSPYDLSLFPAGKIAKFKLE